VQQNLECQQLFYREEVKKIWGKKPYIIHAQIEQNVQCINKHISSYFKL